MDSSHRGPRLGDRMKKVKGLRSTNWELQNSHEDVNYSLGNIVNDIVTTRYGARWVLEVLERTLCKDDVSLTTTLYP